MQTQHTTNTTIDTLEVLYWDALSCGCDALAEALCLALDAAAEAKADDDAPAHGMPRPRFPLAWCQWCRTIDCQCM